MTRNSVCRMSDVTAKRWAASAARASSKRLLVSSMFTLRVRSSVSTVWIRLAFSSAAAFCRCSNSLASLNCSSVHSLGSLSSHAGRSTLNSALPSSGGSSVPPIIMVRALTTLPSPAARAACSASASASNRSRSASSGVTYLSTTTSSSATSNRVSSRSRSSLWSTVNREASSLERASSSPVSLKSSLALSSMRAFRSVILSVSVPLRFTMAASSWLKACFFSWTCCCRMSTCKDLRVRQCSSRSEYIRSWMLLLSVAAIVVESFSSSSSCTSSCASFLLGIALPASSSSTRHAISPLMWNCVRCIFISTLRSMSAFLSFQESFSFFCRAKLDTDRAGFFTPTTVCNGNSTVSRVVSSTRSLSNFIRRVSCWISLRTAFTFSVPSLCSFPCIATSTRKSRRSSCSSVGAWLLRARTSLKIFLSALNAFRTASLSPSDSRWILSASFLARDSISSNSMVSSGTSRS
mmetsp:Transcript_15364/g.42956  ORF Transcript_15364/g.42956 Transcript_15364/m.42956 type:complete len:465 (-) Transcript_15364:372-1766(-)